MGVGSRLGSTGEGRRGAVGVTKAPGGSFARAVGCASPSPPQEGQRGGTCWRGVLWQAAGHRGGAEAWILSHICLFLRHPCLKGEEGLLLVGV